MSTGPTMAFPGSTSTKDGMTLRDWFAGQALAGMASISLEDGDMLMGWHDMAKAAYRAADEMLRRRDLPTTPSE